MFTSGSVTVWIRTVFALVCVLHMGLFQNCSFSADGGGGAVRGGASQLSYQLLLSKVKKREPQTGLSVDVCVCCCLRVTSAAVSKNRLGVRGMCRRAGLCRSVKHQMHTGRMCCEDNNGASVPLRDLQEARTSSLIVLSVAEAVSPAVFNKR